GFATVGDGELYMLYTDPRVWGKGFGRALMDAALAELASRGFDEATLWTEERNERPRWIYERYGWKHDGTVREREYRGTRLRELRYRIPIAARPDIGEVARRELGFDALRPGQEEAVRAVLDGHDTLAVMPTGSGKSAIYELATRIGGGPTVVVSPLLALQRDQVESLAAHGEAAAELNSTLSAGAQEERLE